MVLLLVLTTFVFVIEQVHANAGIGLPYFSYASYLMHIISNVLIVVLVEGEALRRGFQLSWRYAVLVAIVVNLVSMAVGFILIPQFDWVFEVLEKSTPGLFMLATLSSTLLNVTIETPLLPLLKVKLTWRGMFLFVLANLVSTFVILFLVMSE
jgi:hypothetical protein